MMNAVLKTLATAGLGFGAGAAAVLFALGLGGESQQLAQDNARPAAASFADAVSHAAPSVLRVFGRHGTPDGRPGPLPPPMAPGHGPTPGLSRGSAVVVSADGVLVTSAHLVARADAIGVEVPNLGIVDATLLGVDVATDLAVLRVEPSPAPAIKIGSPERLRAGDVVLAIGNPFGLDQTVSLGIVSAVGRTHLGLTEIEDFIQTDAAINPGNSGGALVDAQGKLVGINTAIMSDSGYSEGVAFAVPADRVMRVVEGIASGGTVVRGWLGIGARTLDPSLIQRFGLRASNGVFVNRVMPASPAAAADIRVGDVIVGAGERPVTTSSELREAVIAAGSGARLRLDIRRGSERLQTVAETGLRPSATTPSTRTEATVVAGRCGSGPRASADEGC